MKLRAYKIDMKVKAVIYGMQYSNSFNYAEVITKIYFSKIEKISTDIWRFYLFENE